MTKGYVMKCSTYALLAVMATAVPTVSDAAEFDAALASNLMDGFYAGVEGSFSYGEMKVGKYYEINGNLSGWSYQSLTRTAGGGGIFVGGQQTMGRWVWGLQVGLRKDFAKSQNIDGTMYDIRPGFGQAYSSRISVERDLTWSFGQKIGRLLREDFLVYFWIAAINSRFHVTQANGFAAGTGVLAWASTGWNTSNIALWGAEAGIGAEYALTPEWHLGFGYTYQVYSRLQHDFIPDSFPGGESLQMSVVPRYHRVALTLSYKF